ncbi:MAG: hypothetical protein Q9215_007294 [Flavoplaca cf. flavocitrina]
MDRQPSLNDLNDDVLLEIIAVVKHLFSVEERKERFYAIQRNQQSLWHEMSKGKDGTTSPLSDISRSQLVGPLMALSMTSRRFRNLAAPTIYRSINFAPNEDWWTALGKLDWMANCEAVRVFAKSVRIYGPTQQGDDGGGGDYKGLEPPDQIASRLHGNLSILSNLKELTLVIPQPYSEILKTTFESSSHSFESVRTLILGLHAEWIIAKCPNVEVISACDWSWMRYNVNRKHGDQVSTDLIKAAGAAKRLRHFEMHNRWSHTRLDAVYQVMPQIHVLALPGGMPYKAGLEALLPVLRLFTNLKVLALAELRRLDVGFHPPRCGNVYRGPNGHLVRKRVEREREEAKIKAARMVFAKCLNLEELWIGDCVKVTIVRSGHGNEFFFTSMPRPTPHRNRWDLFDN